MCLRTRKAPTSKVKRAALTASAVRNAFVELFLSALVGLMADILG